MINLSKVCVERLWILSNIFNFRGLSVKRQVQNQRVIENNSRA